MGQSSPRNHGSAERVFPSIPLGLSGKNRLKAWQQEEPEEQKPEKQVEDEEVWSGRVAEF